MKSGSVSHAGSDALPEARNATRTVKQDPLHALLTEHARVIKERARYLAGLDVAYRAEPIDPQWARTTEQALIEVSQGDALVQTGFSPKAWSTQCRARSCKVTAVFDDYDDAQVWRIFS